MKCIAIDDEPLALDIIKRFVSKIPEVSLEATFEDPLEALSYLQQHPVDLLFIDIQMPDINGFQLLNSIPHKPLIIFTTAYAQYAVESYELDAIDYLLKPIFFDRFLKAVNKAQQQLLAQKVLQQSPQNPQSEAPDHLFIKSDTRFFKVNIQDIIFIEGMRDYIAIHTESQKILTLMSMTRMLEKLPSTDFMRVHKSYIIGLRHIRLFQNNRVRVGEHEIPVSNSYKENFLRFIEGDHTDS